MNDAAKIQELTAALHEAEERASLANAARIRGLTIVDWKDRAKAAEAKLSELRKAVQPILAAYRSEPAVISEEQITRAWEVFDG